MGRVAAAGKRQPSRSRASARTLTESRGCERYSLSADVVELPRAPTGNSHMRFRQEKPTDVELKSARTIKMTSAAALFGTPHPTFRPALAE